MSHEQYDNHFNKLIKESLAKKNIVCIKAPIQDYVSDKIIDSKNWFYIYPKFHPRKGLFEISLKSTESEIGSLITGSFWEMLQKKYGEKDIARYRGDVIFDGTETYSPSEFDFTSSGHAVLVAHQNTDIIWECQNREIRVRHVQIYKDPLLGSTTVDEELNKLRKENAQSWPGSGSLAIVYTNRNISEDLQNIVDQESIKKEGIIRNEYERKIDSNKNNL
ncbi:hypothetical protein DUE52_11240 [Larkinella punicea]|uniref:Uncharacterized protein n=2 Tax=Larkinella punicea TaxID=2315727 RepID=A0A368JP23_9BACT|nr:hypothetical protein DUE52_11240 [Larkinella punicea]